METAGTELQDCVLQKKKDTHLLCRTVYVLLQFCFYQFCPVSSSSFNLNTIFCVWPLFLPLVLLYTSNVHLLYWTLTCLLSSGHCSFTGFCLSLYRFISSVGATAFVVFTGLCLCRPLSVHASVFVLICLSSGLEQILGLSVP